MKYGITCLNASTTLYTHYETTTLRNDTYNSRAPRLSSGGRVRASPSSRARPAPTALAGSASQTRRGRSCPTWEASSLWGARGACARLVMAPSLCQHCTQRAKAAQSRFIGPEIAQTACTARVSLHSPWAKARQPVHTFSAHRAALCVACSCAPWASDRGRGEAPCTLHTG